MVAVFDSRKALSEAAVGADRVALVDEKGREGLYVFDTSAHDGTAASNTVQFTSVGADGDTINLDGLVITLKLPPAGEDQVEIAGTITGTAQNFKQLINGNNTLQFGRSSTFVFLVSAPGQLMLLSKEENVTP